MSGSADRPCSWWPDRGGEPTGPEPTDQPAFSVRFRFDQRVADGDLLSDLSGSPAHGLREFRPTVTTDPDGRTEIELTVPGIDVWTSTLIAMAVIRQSGYEPVSMQITSNSPSGERGLAA